MYFIDKRVVQSRELMVKALIELLQNKPLNKVSIKALCDKSGVSRPTFYRNHSSLEELLVKRLKDWYYITFDQFFSDEEYKEDINLRFFKACREEFDFFRIIYKYNLEWQVMGELQKCIDSAFRRRVERGEPIQKSNFFEDYPFSIYAGTGITQMSIKYWIENDSLSAEEITRLVMSYRSLPI